jgi:hypothetical protein
MNAQDLDILVEEALKRGRRFVWWRFVVVDGRLKSRVTQTWNPERWCA